MNVNNEEDKNKLVKFKYNINRISYTKKYPNSLKIVKFTKPYQLTLK